MSIGEYSACDSLALTGMIRSGDVTAEEVWQAAIARASAVDPAINAIVTPRFEAADRQLRDAAGARAAPYFGVPLLGKDGVAEASVAAPAAVASTACLYRPWTVSCCVDTRPPG